MSLGIGEIWRAVQWEKEPLPTPARVPEPTEAMGDEEQVRAFDAETERVSPPMYLLNAHLLSRHVFNGAHLVDLGCGTGGQARILARLFPKLRITGVDLSGSMLERFKQKTRGLPNVEARQEDFCALSSFPDQSVDVVLGNECLHHLPTENHLRSLASTLDRVLTPRGHFLFLDLLPNRNPKTSALLIRAFPRHPSVRLDFKHSLQAAFPLDTWRNAFLLAHRGVHCAALRPLPILGTVSSFPVRTAWPAIYLPGFRSVFWEWAMEQKMDFLGLALGLRSRSQGDGRTP